MVVALFLLHITITLILPIMLLVMVIDDIVNFFSNTKDYEQKTKL
jgi:hypothetical protein